jgi:hypothetical protein
MRQGSANARVGRPSVLPRRFRAKLLLPLCVLALGCTEDDRAQQAIAPPAPPASAGTLDPAAAEVGDSVLGLRIERVDLHRALGDGEEWVGEVEFAGDAELTGTYRPHPDYPELQEVCFFADDHSAGRLPRLAYDERVSWLCFSNQERALDLLGEPDAQGPARVTIDGFTYRYSYTDVYNTARLVSGEPIPQ